LAVKRASELNLPNDTKNVILAALFTDMPVRAFEVPLPPTADIGYRGHRVTCQSTTESRRLLRSLQLDLAT